MFINHCHVFPEAWFSKKNPKWGTLERLTEIMDKLGIDKAVVFPPYSTATGQEAKARAPAGWWLPNSNQWLYEALKRHNNLVGFFTASNPKDPNEVKLLEEMTSKGFKGVKMHPPIIQVHIDDPALEPFYSKAEELNIPILFHTGLDAIGRLSGQRPILLDEVAQNHPHLKIIVEHMGLYEFFQEALAVVRNNPNCYAGITDIVRWEPTLMIRLLKRSKAAGYDVPSRTIYGTDFPAGRGDSGEEDIKSDIEIIRSWHLPKEDEYSILGGALQRILE